MSTTLQHAEDVVDEQMGHPVYQGRVYWAFRPQAYLVYASSKPCESMLEKGSVT